MKFVLGFDGGGTKTDCVLLGEQGTVIARSRSGPSNPYRIGVAAAAAAIREAADRAVLEASLARSAIWAVGAGLAGTGNLRLKEEMTAALERDFPGARLSVFTDLEASLFAAGEGAVIVLVAGTGSAAIGRDPNGQIWRSGGLGFRFSDEGSGFDIGQCAVIRSRRDFEKQGTDSVLGAQILRSLRFRSWEELRHKTELAPDEVFPQVFPLVADAADAGEPESQELLHHAAGQLADLVNSVAEHFGGPGARLTIVRTGGIVGRSRFFDAQLDAALERVLPGAAKGELRISAAEAAARAVLSGHGAG